MSARQALTLDSETGFYNLHQDYLLYYQYHEVFSKELIQIDLKIDLLHCYEINYSYQLNNVDNVQYILSGPLPARIGETFSLLITARKLKLQKYYNEGFTMEDMPFQHYVINHQGSSINIGMSGSFPLEHHVYENDVENNFYHFHKQVVLWTRQVLEQLVLINSKY